MHPEEGSQLEKALRLGAGRVGFEAVVPNPKLKLLDQVREVMRLRHYSIRTEQSYCDWIRRHVRFHRMKSRAELMPGEAKIEQFLSDLALQGRVAAATQNQAFNALLFLYREVLHEPFQNVQAIRAKRPVRVPTVLTPDEVKRVIGAMSGTTQLVAKLLYGGGLRLLEGLRLRVQDLDFEMKQLTVSIVKGVNTGLQQTEKKGRRCGRVGQTILGSRAKPLQGDIANGVSLLFSASCPIPLRPPPDPRRTAPGPPPDQQACCKAPRRTQSPIEPTIRAQPPGGGIVENRRCRRFLLFLSVAAEATSMRHQSASKAC
jgi:hypothetical protein